VTGQVRLIAALNTEAENLGEVVADHFGRHRDTERYLSLPGLGVVLSARILARVRRRPEPLPRCQSPARTTPAPPRSPAPPPPAPSC
jgi:hypothetical protein